MTHLLALAFLFTASPPAVAAARPEPSAPRLDLNGALRRALEKSPQYRALKLTEKNAELAEKNAWRALLPVADVQAEHSYSRLDEATTAAAGAIAESPWSSRLGFSVTETLYDNGESWRKTKITGLQRELESLNLESGRSRLEVDVAKAFYDYSSAVAELDLQEQQLESLRLQERSIESRYRRGLSSNRDFLRITAQVRTAEIGLLTRRMSIEEARGALRTAVGDAGADFAPLKPGALAPDDVPVPALDIERVYDIRAARLQDRVSELREEAARRSNWPRVSLTGSYNYEIPRYLGPRRDGLDDPSWNLRAALVLDYRLWDWGRTARDVEIAANTLSIERATREQSRLRIEQDLRQLRDRAEVLRSSLRMSREILRASEAAYRNVNQAYLEGRTTYLEFIAALNDYSASRSQELTLRFGVLKLQADLAHAQGTVDDLFQIR